ncbi:glutamate/tyrosine decarboxylase-like PLP-dependent enzyme [Archangium gephyra]|uniref:Glutamate/tyrosine decarboxylase-like PLP-dependent enzyme n=1 Tax=Archangium gephyra TaxID=48 RepID=A0AAC8QHJ4_9BACT|nr:aminotransferase class V-fold PLP-dependent enzyme [Archangium gephyra]AKJ07589.1 Sphingosine-1-phosphate lyase [Archangium gephyra]REG29346.1 glutamate/tyrosine decarboxylase-like PLP-dependent enzyme [Archangium gephyra]
MDLPELGANLLNRVPPRLLSAAERYLKNIPLLRDRLEKETDSMLADLEGGLKPYRGQTPTFDTLPSKGLSHEQVLKQMEDMRQKEEDRWKDGYVSGAVYHGDSGHIDFLNRVYAINSQANPLHADLWPSATKFEAEVVAMTAHMLGAAEANAGRAPDEHICGALSSGGTESIMLAMKTYRDWARDTKGITHPEMVAPSSAHPAFDKAAHYFGIKMVRVPVGPDYRADVKATRKAITRNTIVLIGSAPGFPHGVIDPIEELSELARKRGIGFHTDACLGGFVLPWARKLGYPVPDFDFRLPGVTTMSADTHKFGYAAKGTSVVLYRGTALRSYQYFTATEWPGGIYFSPTFSGSRPGALIAAAWASLVATGEEGYLDATRRILETADVLKRGIRSIPGMHVLGEPLFVIAFGSDDVNIYKVMEHMGEKGWSLNGLHKPAAVHLCVTQRHTQPGVAERFLEDLKAAIAHVRAHPEEKGTMAPVYGMAGTVPFRGLLSDLLKKYMDLIYKV